MILKEAFYFIATSFLCIGIYMLITSHNEIMKEQLNCNISVNRLLLQQTSTTNELKKINLTLKQWELAN
jgi:hypothetical protein